MLGFAGFCNAGRTGGEMEDNDVLENELAGIEVRNGASPTVKGNRVERGRGSGILVCEEGAGHFADNIVRGCAKAGVVIRSRADPLLVDNQICDGLVCAMPLHV
jgi:F-box protein 11